MSVAAALLKPLIATVGRDKLSILIYHRVHKEADPIFPEEQDARRFDAQLERITKSFHVMPLPDAVAALNTGGLPSGAVCITFDDGYADNAEIALPILRRHAVSATFFISTGFLDGGRMWNDSVIESIRRASTQVLDLRTIGLGVHDIGGWAARRAAIEDLIGQLKYLPQDERQEKVDHIEQAVGERLPNDLMLRSEQVRALVDASMTVGAHTMSHPILARLPAAAARREIAAGRETLESIIGKPVTLFAYPNGKPGDDYTLEHVTMVRELQFQAAVCTAWGAASKDDDLFQLPRFTPWDQSAWRFSLRLTGNLLRQATTLQNT